MKKPNQQKWQKKYPKGKAPLSWTQEDYLVWNDEPPACLSLGITEGQSMEAGDIENWIVEEIKSISVIREEYPEKYIQLERDFWLDLEYLSTLGKITKEEIQKLKKQDLFNFGSK